MSKNFDPRKQASLLTAEREAQLQPHALLTSLGLKAGDVMADVGCGPGFFAIPAAEIVGPTGRIIAADVESDMLNAIITRVCKLQLDNKMQLDNVDFLKASKTDVALPTAGVDLILLAFMLHEVSQRSCYLFRLRPALRPTGRVAVVGWEGASAATVPVADGRLSAEELLADARAAGFGLVERRQLTPEHYALTLIAR